MSIPFSSESRVFLKPEVKLEPLMCRFYAWPHLIAPAQLALHITYRLLPLLKSFSTNPAVHLNANADPTMYGGPFMSLAESDVARIEALIAETRLECADLVAFAQELRDFDAKLQEKATGYSLNEFYAHLPGRLQGLVELVYDIHHRPSIRLFEPLVYDAYPMAHAQEIMLELTDEKNRHFFMSTPRIETDTNMSFKMRFRDARIDTLARMRGTAAPFREVAELFQIGEQQLSQFSQFFTEVAPPAARDADYGGEEVRMRYFGHACVLFQTADVSILFDPFVALEPGADERFTIHDLPEVIDHVVISHAHQDHFAPEMLIQLRHRIKHIIVPANNSGSIGDPSMKLVLKELGFDNVTVVDCFEAVDVPGGRIESLPFTGEHADLPIYTKHAIALTLKQRKFLFLVDSDGRDKVLYERIMRKIGKVDVLFIGMECHGAPLNWLYEPLLGKPVNRRNNESRRLSGADCPRASSILSVVNPQRVFIYAMGQEPWMQYIMGLQYSPDSIQLIESDAFIAHCQGQGIDAERLYLSRELLFQAKTAPA